MEIDITNNPWAVEAVEDFLYFCCPECDVRNRTKEEFFQHAFEHHPKSKVCLLRFEVKKEPFGANIIEGTPTDLSQKESQDIKGEGDENQIGDDSKSDIQVSNLDQKRNFRNI